MGEMKMRFLTDDEIFLGFKSKGNESERNKYFGCDFQNEFSYGFNMFSPHSDLSSPVESVVGSTETESDEDDYISELTRQIAHSTLETENHKSWGLSNSPQSTLCGMNSKKGSVDLLYEAAEEVARMKMMQKIGTWAPPMKNSPVFTEAPRNCKPNPRSFYTNQPQLFHQQLQMAQFHLLKQQQRMKQLGLENDGFLQYPLSQNHQQFSHVRVQNGANRPMNSLLKPSWPTPQQSPQQQHQRMLLGNTGPKRGSAGTGVFIPRTQTETRKKQGCSTVLMPDRVVQPLNLNLNFNRMDSRSQPQVQPKFINGGVLKHQNNVAVDQQRRNLRAQPPTMPQELLLPQEWTY